jgi:hypothetical protein
MVGFDLQSRLSICAIKSVDWVEIREAHRSERWVSAPSALTHLTQPVTNLLSVCSLPFCARAWEHAEVLVS